MHTEHPQPASSASEEGASRDYQKITVRTTSAAGADGSRQQRRQELSEVLQPRHRGRGSRRRACSGLFPAHPRLPWSTGAGAACAVTRGAGPPRAAAHKGRSSSPVPRTTSPPRPHHTPAFDHSFLKVPRGRQKELGWSQLLCKASGSKDQSCLCKELPFATPFCPEVLYFIYLNKLLMRTVDKNRRKAGCHKTSAANASDL
ncbi:uncharacterized protein LOC141954482 [Strix uralensis]|uniref:uncharacterized protein LOC141954482 n=1 Tax=Strix uralensis TaxID=36305 RepID=UPI003DA6E195